MNDSVLLSSARPRVGLFVTCLVDLFRPNVGFAAIKLLEDAGCDVHVPELQVCCGQPAYNTGDSKDARDLACRVIEAFGDFDYLVAPSGSCAGMIKEHYPRLFAASTPWRTKAQDLATCTHELLSFLTDVMHVERVDAQYAANITYHDSCAGLREMGVHDQPRALLSSVAGLSLTEMRESNVCCGFGGTFCVKFPRISERMVAEKTRSIEDSGADVLLGGDMGCLLNVAGRLKRAESKVAVYHTAEVLAGMAQVPGIGDGEES
ncbi:MAG: L-lactate dehydrogenase complex protein LldE [Gammaproteobacteria bacterium]|jgi:L-lactate dehydrogenase complex protein LldE